MATIPWREITMDRASDLSCDCEGMEDKIESRPIVTFNLVGGLSMEFAIIAPSTLSMLTFRL